MSIQLKIAEPQAGASEVATKTRESLQQWILSVQDKCDADLLQPMSPDQIQLCVQAGKDAYSFCAERATKAQTPAGNAMAAFVRALNTLGGWIEGDARDASHRLEGVMRAFARHVFENQIEFNALDHRTYMDLMAGGTHMGGVPYAHAIVYAGSGDLYIQPFLNSVGNTRLAWALGFQAQRVAQRATGDLQAAHRFEYHSSPHSLGPANGYYIVPLGYMDTDGPWVAGFLTPDDTARFRFTRKRLGAWLKDSGVYNDESIRITVEAAKAEQAGGVFTIYPNDVLFGDIYHEGRVNVSSCMAASADEYSTWDGIHPCDTYSTAYHGVGDNGLALFTAENQDGALIGRGIWNRGTKKIVRWYGDEKKYRALRRLGMERDAEALEGAFIAYINNGSRFIAPYVDGDIECGKVAADEGRVYIQNSGVNLSETSGVVGVDTVWCVDWQEYYDRDECTYQSEHNNWVYGGHDDWVCAVTNEWVDDHQRDTIHLDGELVEVSDRVIARSNQYLREIEPTEEMLEYAEENDEPVPTNYEIR